MTVALPSDPAEAREALKKQLKQLKKLRESDPGVGKQIKALKKQLKALGAPADSVFTSAPSEATTAAAPAPSEVTTAGAGGGDGASSGKSKKKKDKKQKREREATAAAAEEPAAATEQEQDQQPKKKAKKDKAAAAAPAAKAAPAAAGTAADGAVASDQPMAAVGDRSLAASRPALSKNLYRQAADVAAMSAAEVAAWRAERSIVLLDEGSGSGGKKGGKKGGSKKKGGEDGEDGEQAAPAPPLFNPLLSFQRSGLSAQQLHATRTFAAPSPIQAQCLPIALSGRDLIGIAATGSGKTLAFGLPALAHVAAQIASGAASGRKPAALVIAPTRELAIQISSVLEEAGQNCGVGALCVYGGVPKRDQANALRKGAAQIVVATPGRLEDLMNDNACKLDEVSYLVLDEADRMLDLGFEPHIRAIAGATRADRQTLMFSATWPPAIRKLASEFLSHPVRVTIGSQDLAASHSVKQIVEVIEAPVRDNRLHELLQGYHKSRKNRIIVFVLYKKEAVRVEQFLGRKGWKAVAIHGDILQGQRSAAVESFKTGEVPLLVATDVAARGLDIPDVEVVINYSFPLTTEDYVHRIGRTGRAGKTGTAHTLFVGANDRQRAGELVNVLREAKQDVPADLLKFGTTVKKKESKLYGAHFKDVDHTQKATKMTFDSDDE